jgi:small subunit ribosomal protein S24e
MEIKIIQQQQNILLKRKEIAFEIDHTQTKGTPSRIEIRNRLADLLKTKPELVYVKLVETKTGTMKANGQANAYETVEQAKRVEPKYIIARNTPAAEKKTEKAAEKPAEKAEQKPAEKPKAETAAPAPEKKEG